MAPVKEEDYYEVLSSFPAHYDIYEERTKNTGKLHVNKCNYVKRHFDRENDYNQYFSTCQKIAIFIEYLKVNDNIGDKNITCKHLNYLINSQIRKFNHPPYETQEFYMKIIEEYETQGYPLKTVCNGFIEHLEKDIFEKIQKLYNLYYEFHKFKNLNTSPRECKKFSEYVQLYVGYMKDCEDKSQEAFCEALKKFSLYCYAYNNILIDCPQERSSLLSYTLKEYTVGDVVDDDGEDPAEGSKENDESDPNAQHHMGLVGQHGLLHDRSSGFSEDRVDAPPDNSSGSNGSSNGTIIPISLVGTFCSLFLLYKFTPIRSMIDPRIRKTKKTLENPMQRSDELNPHDHNDYFTIVDINRYNVGYQSR
ncbi:Plasmodium vivax Vir protein, putative [Plasmodium vivax]|uniref:Vir protein, putative n=1 Tax=Plasmodium vivax TaxID=5855 RepID=A0A1G4ED26_PLAVI|nr:Plasmodium vivax Vir protein, putative [Plasmodium vivax]